MEAEISAASEINSSFESKTATRCFDKPILFVVDSDFESYKQERYIAGGAELQALALAKALGEKGVKVELLIPSTEQEYFHDNEHDGIRIHRVIYKRIKFLGALSLMFQFGAWILRNQKEYAFIHVHITKLLAAALGVIKPWLKIQVITKISGHYEFTGGVLDNNQKTNLKLIFLRAFTRKLDFVHSVSQYTSQMLLDNGFNSQQIIDIPNTVDTNRFSNLERVDDGCINIGYCGRLEAVKGLELLFKAVSLLDESQCSKVRIRIAGDGDHLSVLQSEMEQLGLEAQVEFLGRIQNVPEFLATLDIYTQPSYAEGLPNSVLEAMSDGLPVVASRISGNVDLVEEGVNGYLFESGDSIGFSEKLKQLISDKALRNHMGAKGREKIEQNYSTDSVSARFIKLYYGS